MRRRSGKTAEDRKTRGVNARGVNATGGVVATTSGGAKSLRLKHRSESGRRGRHGGLGDLRLIAAAAVGTGTGMAGGGTGMERIGIVGPAMIGRGDTRR